MKTKHLFPFQKGTWVENNLEVPDLPPLVDAAAARYLGEPSLRNFEILLLAVHDAAANTLPYPMLPSDGGLTKKLLDGLTFCALWNLKSTDEKMEVSASAFVTGRIRAGMRRLLKEGLIVEEKVALVDISAIELHMSPETQLELMEKLPPHLQEEVTWLLASIEGLGHSNLEKFKPEHQEIRERRLKYVETVTILTKKGMKELSTVFDLDGDAEDASPKGLDPRIAKSTPMTCAEFGSQFGKDASWAYRQFKKGAGFKPKKNSKAIFWFNDWIEALERRSRTL